MTVVRPEMPSDEPAIRAVHTSAFLSPVEADLVDALRRSARLLVSLVVELRGDVVGHVAFSPVTVEGSTMDERGVGLAPLAVAPASQRQGLGGLLVMAGLRASENGGHRFVVLLGSPAYYGRFGFTPGSAAGLTCLFGSGPEFQVRELVPGGLPRGGGRILYAPEFDAFLP
jgi:putative acetyltransferase